MQIQNIQKKRVALTKLFIINYLYHKYDIFIF